MGFGGVGEAFGFLFGGIVFVIVVVVGLLLFVVVGGGFGFCAVGAFDEGAHGGVVPFFGILIEVLVFHVVFHIDVELCRCRCWCLLLHRFY